MEENEGIMHTHMSFAEAVANGSKSMAEFLLENGADIDQPCRDGTTPLCAASLWGNESMVSFLLKNGANVNVENEGTKWTALHAAAFQEHGRIVRTLLEHQANPLQKDAEGRTPVDYASISEAIWPLFSAQGCERSLKSDLIDKGIIRKISMDQPETSMDFSSKSEHISTFSRPGSAYVRGEFNPMQPPMNIFKPEKKISKVHGPIDPLSSKSLSNNQTSIRPSLGGLRL